MSSLNAWRVGASIVAAIAWASCGPESETARAQLPPQRWTASGEFGRENAPDEEVIGELTDLTIHPDGYVLLDAKGSRLSLIDTSGSFVAAYEGAGSGPGEFQVPAAIANINGRGIIVADRANTRLSLFTVALDSLIHERDVRIEHESRDLCVLENSVFVLGDHNGHMLHMYDTIGNFVASVVEPAGGPPEIQVDDPAHDRLMSNGYILCDPERERILFVSAYFGFVRVLDARGRDIQMLQLPLFRPMAITPDTRGGVRMANPEGFNSYHRVIGVTKGFGHYWLQIAEDFGPSAAQQYYYSNVLVSHDLATVTGPLESPFGGAFLIAGQKALVKREDPYPRIVFMTPDTIP